MNKGDFQILKYFILLLNLILMSACATGPTPDEIAQAERLRIEQKQSALREELQRLNEDKSHKSIWALINFSNINYSYEVSRQAYNEARKRLQEVGKVISGKDLEMFIFKCENPSGKIYVSKMEDNDFSAFRISTVTKEDGLDHVSIIMNFHNIEVQRYDSFINGSERERVYIFKDQAWAQTIYKDGKP